MKQIRKLCDEHDILLIVDEIQCGNGRTGKYFAYQHYDIQPDIITIAKGLAGGLPIGACIVKEDVANYMTKGSHGSTFGGNGLCCCVGNDVIDVLSDKEFLENVVKISNIFNQKLQDLMDEYKNIFVSKNGMGLMIGLHLNKEMDAHKFAELLFKNGLSCACAGGNSIRFLTPLIITEKHIDEAINIIKKTINEDLV